MVTVICEIAIPLTINYSDCIQIVSNSWNFTIIGKFGHNYQMTFRKQLFLGRKGRTEGLETLYNYVSVSAAQTKHITVPLI